MKITEIAFTGIPVTDMKRAREFYEGVLGLTPDPEMTGDRWTEYPIGNGTLTLGCIGEEWKPSDRASGGQEGSVFPMGFAGLPDGRNPGSGWEQADHSQTEN